MDVVKEFYEVLNNDLSHKHQKILEYILIGIFIIFVLTKIFWNILLKDVIGVVG